MARVLRSVLDTPYELVVVYDDPADTTIAAVQSMGDSGASVRLVHNSLGRGVTKAIKAGALASRGRYVLIFAADELGPVMSIADMLTLMHRGCDLVSCTRYARGGRRLGGSPVGGALSRVANYIFWRFTGFPLTDATTGIKMCRREILVEMSLEARVGWACAFELAYKAYAAGLRLGEVPIISIDRLYGGESSFKLGPWLIEYFRWFVRGAVHVRGSRRQAAHPPLMLVRALAPAPEDPLQSA